MTKPSLTATEEHRPPTADDTDEAGRGHPFLLAAFPKLVAVPVPASDEVVGREWLRGAGIDDTKVSGQHVRFVRAGGQLQFEDARARNGIHVDGKRIGAGQRVFLDDGAVLRLGGTLFVYREAFTGPPSPQPPLGELVGPWGLTTVRNDLATIARAAHDPVRQGKNRMVKELNVLLHGETGTGKELLAQAVRGALGRGDKPYLPLNVAAIPAGVLDAQLFGWKKGAYSGAGKDDSGVLRNYEGGTVFLDEIGELPLELQPKLLRLLESREILPVGGKAQVRIDVALIAATNQPLGAMVAKGTFRRDFLARFLSQLELPPLHERPEDLFAIWQAIQTRRGAPCDPEATEIEAVEQLMLQQWLANVRDLERLATLMGPSAPLKLRAVKLALERMNRAPREREGAPVAAPAPAVLAPPAPAPEAAPSGDIQTQMRQQEKQLCEGAIRETRSIAEAARRLGMPRTTLVYRLEKLGIKPPKR